MAAIGMPLEFADLGKRFGEVEAVSALSFRVEPGRVTGFLGPNGAGKTTTLRMLLGLVRPSTGSATIGGRSYSELDRPARAVGASLDAAFHPGRSGRDQLRVLARAGGLPAERVGEVLALVGMEPYARRRIGGYSLGMRQRLGLAAALLGDPAVLVLDEPINGLDPEGIRWMRGLLRQLAGEGRTVLVSSHLLSEVQQTVDDVVVIAGGRLRFAGRLDELSVGGPSTVVDADDRARLAEALTAAGHAPTLSDDGLVVAGVDPGEVGRLALAAGVPLRALGARRAGLEDEFLALVDGAGVAP